MTQPLPTIPLSIAILSEDEHSRVQVRCYVDPAGKQVGHTWRAHMDRNTAMRIRDVEIGAWRKPF